MGTVLCEALPEVLRSTELHEIWQISPVYRCFSRPFCSLRGSPAQVLLFWNSLSRHDVPQVDFFCGHVWVNHSVHPQNRLRLRHCVTQSDAGEHSKNPVIEILPVLSRVWAQCYAKPCLECIVAFHDLFVFWEAVRPAQVLSFWNSLSRHDVPQVDFFVATLGWTTPYTHRIGLGSGIVWLKVMPVRIRKILWLKYFLC